MMIIIWMLHVGVFAWDLKNFKMNDLIRVNLEVLHNNKNFCAQLRIIPLPKEITHCAVKLEACEESRKVWKNLYWFFDIPQIL